MPQKNRDGGMQQIRWGEATASASRVLIQLARQEDLDRAGDVTTQALVRQPVEGSATVLLREEGTVCGLALIPLILQEFGGGVGWKPGCADGTTLAGGTPLGVLQGDAAAILTVERTILNFLGRLSGIASLTAKYVARVAGTGCVICDTRKTAPGWRLLEKYAVHCGGGCNHRTGLYDAVLIKDNHLALAEGLAVGVDTAVRVAREYLAQSGREETPVEIEVDSLEQLQEVFQAPAKDHPDIVLLDNMTPDTLRQGVACRNHLAPDVLLEASGGIELRTVRAVAETGVERISVGALTHSAKNLDVGLDWGDLRREA